MGLIADLIKISGMIHRVRQRCLIFGRDRRMAVEYRPAVEVRRLPAHRVVVLPCTSRTSEPTENFFELPRNQMLWKRPTPKPTFVYYRYEVVPQDCLCGQIGVLGQNLRMELTKWLRERWCDER